MRIRIFTIGLILITFFSVLNAQLAMGKWRTHFAYNAVNQIAQSENKIFAVSEGALFSVDKEDQGIEFYSKLSGLSGVNISRIECDPQSQQLLITYVNGSIDILSSSGVVNIADLYNKQMSFSKSINDIFFKDDKAYLSCNFGIVVLNMTKHEVSDTYYIGANGSAVQVLSTAIHNSYIYAVTPTTIYKGLASEFNLVNFEFWSTLSGLPGSGNLQKIGSHGGKLILLRDNKLYVQDENEVWSTMMSQISVSNFYLSNNKLLIYDASGSVYVVDESFNTSLIENLGEALDGEYDSARNSYWFAGNADGVISYDANGGILKYKPKGPAVNIPWNMTFSGQKLFVVQGGRWSAQYMRWAYVMIYENETWTNLLPNPIITATGVTPYDFMNVAVDPLDNKHFFVTSYGAGLYEFKNDAFNTWYNPSNSTVETIIPTKPYEYIRLDGAVLDANGNLFVANSSMASGIKVRLNDGTWTQLTYPDVNKPTLGKILISNQNPNQKWIPSVRYTPGIFIFDDNGTITDQSDDQSVFLSSFPDIENSEVITPTNYFCVAQDHDGVVWVGTEQGPLLFYNTSNVFNEGYACSRVKIPRNDGTGLADFLLESESVKVIAIDGANRKWIGTVTSGVYLMSENGQETIHHFTVSNSPLLSNNILSIAINPVSGEVFFGTAQGIVSYQSDASDGGSTFKNVHAYPNPVREGYTGVITITGLVENTQVKITDLNGNLVCETVSNGGIATWDGKTVRGRKVSTGVYLAICVNEDGTQSTITKIMVIN